MTNIWSNARKSIWSYVFVLPMLILFLGFTVYPLVASVQYTFYDWDGIGAPNDFIGFENYVDIPELELEEITFI